MRSAFIFFGALFVGACATIYRDRGAPMCVNNRAVCVLNGREHGAPRCDPDPSRPESTAVRSPDGGIIGCATGILATCNANAVVCANGQPPSCAIALSGDLSCM